VNVLAPQHLHDVGEGQSEAERENDLVKLSAQVEAHQPELFDQGADKRCDYRRDKRRGNEAVGIAPRAKPDLGPEQKERPVRQIDHAQQPEGQAEAQCQQEKEHAVHEAVQGLDGDKFRHGDFRR
jgi:hypothetical protein